jgi:PAS domain S-box-containing protein
MNSEHILKELQDQKFALDQSAIVATTDPRGVITYINDKFCEISGYEREELIGRTHKIINSGNHDPAFFVNMWRTIAQGKVWRGEVCNRRKDGSIYWVMTTIVPFLDANRSPYQYLAVRHDITALKAAQQTIIEQQSKLIAASKFSALGEISASITHEINNPLSVIMGRNEMLQIEISKDDFDKSKLLKLCETIAINAHRIEKIIKSMRTFARDASNDDFEKVLLRDIISEALELTEQRFRDHKIRFEIKISNPEIVVECRRTQIMQILVNLLNNAHDALMDQKDNTDKWARLVVHERENLVEIEVEDNGPGVPPSLQSKIFDPFFSTKDIQFGTGLGLSISRQLAQLHKGELYLDPLCMNTCFYLRIPKSQGTHEL